MTSKLAIVTGGSGFIGSHLCERLLADGYRVAAIDNLVTGRASNIESFKSHPNFQFIEKDAAHPELRSLFLEAAYVFHQAAIPSVPRSFEMAVQCHEANCTLTMKLLDLLKSSTSLQKFVFASSSSVYGDTPTLPKITSMPVDPLSPYATQKFMSERYCQIFAKNFGTPTVALRYFNVFGPRQDPNSVYSAVIPKFISLVKDKKPVTVFGDGKQTRDFTFVRNAVEANICAALRGIPGKVYNVATGSRISLLDLIRSIDELFGTKSEVQFLSNRVGDVKDSLADIEPIQADAGYRVLTDFQAGLKETWKSLLA